jgi:hypothetical protein
LPTRTTNDMSGLIVDHFSGTGVDKLVIYEARLREAAGRSVPTSGAVGGLLSPTLVILKLLHVF